MKVSRADLRGKRLEDFCQKAKISHNECGPHDNRLFCYGLVSRQTDELIEECENCKANVKYVECEKKDNIVRNSYIVNGGVKV